MSEIHQEIFSKKQEDILPGLKKFSRKYYLVGGTAIALHIGHRRSIDFNLFTKSPIIKSRLNKQLDAIPYRRVPIHEDVDQLHVMLNEVKLTFFHYPYPIHFPLKLPNGIKFPELLTLAVMKAFALGRRAKWKDYVDMYFILKDQYTIEDICTHASKILEDHFAEKLFRQQLAYHKDIDYTETVEYLMPAPADDEIRDFLIEKSVSF